MCKAPDEGGDLERQFGQLRVRDEAPVSLVAQALPVGARGQSSAHYCGYTNDPAPSGDQWAWARHFLRTGGQPVHFVDGELWHQPLIARIMCYLLGCADCEFAPPDLDSQIVIDPSHLPPANPDWELSDSD